MEERDGIEARLAAWPTAMVSDALDELGINGALARLRAMREGPGRICGRALPVRFVRKDRDPEAWRFGGGLASRLAQRCCVRGTVMWGARRDLEEIRAVGYPVWAIGTCPRRNRNAFAFGSIGEPLRIGEVVIAEGDYLVADETGVVRVPAGKALEVLRLVERIERQEAALAAQVRDDAVSSWDQV